MAATRLFLCASGLPHRGLPKRGDPGLYRAQRQGSAAALARNTNLHKSRPRPQVTWTLPKDWRETEPGRMSVASFSIAAASGQEAQVTITPLPKLAGQEALIVNMSREQISIKTNSTEEIARQLQPVEVGSEAGHLFEVTGNANSSGGPIRIVTAMVHRPDGSWFYKLAGDAALVEAQKPAFIRVPEVHPPGRKPRPRMEAPALTSSTARLAGARASGRSLPPARCRWRSSLCLSAVRRKADVVVSVFPSDTGGNSPTLTAGETDRPARRATRAS